ncbi:MAG TPA: TMEM175 family protein [Ktedonobacteraceae bacterium]|jgi:uncharacterized membrane protein
MNDEVKETGRVEAFSDGVFAIAITLLILEIPVPGNSPRLATDVWLHWPSFAGYAISFLSILVMWMNHHTIFEMVRRINRIFLFLNGLLLMLITFVNYPTALVAAYFNQSGETFAALFYNSTFVVIALIFNILWLYASSHGRLLSRSVSPARVRSITVQYRFGPVFYLAAFLLAFVSVPASLATDLLLAIFFCFSGINNRSRARPDIEQEGQDQLPA